MRLYIISLSILLCWGCSIPNNSISTRGNNPGSKDAEKNGGASNGGPTSSNPPESNNSDPKPPLPPYPTDLISPDDFTFLGSYPVTVNPQMTFGKGLTLRYVNGELRFMAPSYDGPTGATLIEFKLPPGGFGTTITSAYKTNQWDNIWNPHDPTNTLLAPNVGGGDEYSFWWEDQGNGNGRLWTTHCTDYPDDVISGWTRSIAVRSLNANGTISNHFYEYGLEGIGQRAIYGGVQKIPENFRAENGLVNQPYLVGWGGYTSRMAAGKVPSMGFMAVAIPDITTYPVSNATEIPASAIKIVADHRSGTVANDWYQTPGNPFSFDRGVRNADVINYFDGGDIRNNPPTPPDFPPIPGARWLSPAPDGKGRWVWGDSFHDTGNWIVGEKKQGFIAIGTFSGGKAYYSWSTLHRDYRHAELQIFDPRDFAKVLKGEKKPWNVEPAASKLLNSDLTPLGLLYGNDGGTASGGVSGAAYDPTTKTLWLWCTNVNGGYGIRLVAYKVNI